MIDKAVNALIAELENQRAMLGNRAAQLAASNAVLSEKLEAAQKRIAELENPTAAPQ